VHRILVSRGAFAMTLGEFNDRRPGLSRWLQQQEKRPRERTVKLQERTIHAAERSEGWTGGPSSQLLRVRPSSACALAVLTVNVCSAYLKLALDPLISGSCTYRRKTEANSA
jgi:hypothetical protein